MTIKAGLEAGCRDHREALPLHPQVRVVAWEGLALWMDWMGVAGPALTVL